MAQRVKEVFNLFNELKMPRAADEYFKQSEDPKYSDMSFDDRLAILLNRENEGRTNSTILKNMNKARLSILGADLVDLNKNPSRKLNLETIEALRSNDYIRSGLGVIIIGATGSGKTWLSCAYGMCALKDKLKVRYYRLSQLLNDIQASRSQCQYRQFIKYLNKFDLLIIDDFLLYDTNDIERADLLEILELRINRKSIIYASQFSPEGWHNKLGGGPIADAILDRIINSSYTLYLQGESLREEYSPIKR